NNMLYNIANGGSTPMRGRKHTEFSKKLMSKVAMGKPGTNTGKTFDDEWRFKISKANTEKDNISKRRFSPEVEQEICKLYMEEEKSTYALGKEFNCQRT